MLTTTHNAAQNLTQKERAEIHSLVKSFAVLADRNAYEYLSTLFTKQVIVDYTSAFGGDVNTVDVEELMLQWSKLLPGFDFTYHDISVIKIKPLQPQRLSVTANVLATHYIGDSTYWQIKGQYNFEVVNTTDNWRINKLTFVMDSENGSRDLLNKASERADNGIRKINLN